MVCDTVTRQGQTLEQRMEEVVAAAKRIDQLIAAGGARVVIGPQGAIVFTGLTDSQRDGLTDACIYRRLMASGSAAARTAITRAEQLAGRGVDRRTVAQGVHSHDGGRTWSAGHGRGR